MSANFKEDWRAIEAFRARCTHPDRHVLKMNGIPTECRRCGKQLCAPTPVNSTVQL